MNIEQMKVKEKMDPSMSPWKRTTGLIEPKSQIVQYQYIWVLGRDNIRDHWRPSWMFLMSMVANNIRGWMEPTFSRHLSYSWGKSPKKLHPGNLSRPGIEPGPTAWQACMLPLAPQRWTAQEARSPKQEKSQFIVLNIQKWYFQIC